MNLVNSTFAPFDRRSLAWTRSCIYTSRVDLSKTTFSPGRQARGSVTVIRRILWYKFVGLPAEAEKQNCCLLLSHWIHSRSTTRRGWYYPLDGLEM